MIHKTGSFQNLSPLRQQAPAPETPPVVKDPSDGWVGGVGPGKEVKPPELPASPDSQAEGHKETGGRTALKVALGLVGVGGALLSMAAPAQAQVQVRPAATTQARTLADSFRDTKPVFAGSVQDVVNQFSASRQIYVVGQPQYQGQNLDMKQFQDVFAKHPNAYVVLIAQSDNVKSDDYALARGIANSPQFKGVVDKETGQPNGSVFMVYFKVTDQKFIQQTGKDRAIYMRSEQLLDDADVGENDFVDRETLEPRTLMQTYVDAVRGGQGVPQAFGQVLDKIDAGVEKHVGTTVRGAQAVVDQADKQLDSVGDKAKDFQRKHGAKGSLGQPPLDSWKAQLKSAKDSLKARDYGAASQTAKSLQTALAQYEGRLAQFEQAPQQAQEIRTLITELEQQVTKLPGNGQAQQARESLQQAKDQMAAYQQRYDANELDFQPQLEGARTAAQQTQHHIQASTQSEAAARNIKLYGSAAVGVGLIATALILNLKARGRRKEAEAELDEAIAAMGGKSKELIRVMNEADVTQIAAFTGTTQKLAKELLANTAEALALMGGGEKVLAEAGDLIKGTSFGSRLKNMFASGNFDKAVELLTDKEHPMPYELSDAKNLNLEKGSRAEAWREHLMSVVVSKAGQESFVQMLDQLGKLAAGNDKTTQVLLKESREVGAYLDGVKASAGQTQEASLSLKKQDEQNNTFTAPSVTKRVIPAVEQLMAKGHEVKGTDPFRARQEFGEVGERMLGDANQIIGVGNFGRSHTLPILAEADAALQPHQISTEWAHFRKQELSLQLDRAGEKAVEAAVKGSVDQLKQDMQALESRVQTVVQLDDRRWTVAQPQIADAEQAVATARDGLCGALKAAGVFKDGKPEQVLREPDRDPSASLYQSRQNYEAIKPLLDKGNVEEPPTHLQNVAHLTQQAHKLVDDSRKAFEAYPASSGERRSRHASITGSIPEKYKPSLDRIEQGYSAAAQRSVVPEVSAGTSKVKIVGEFLEDTFRLLDKGATITDQAQYNYDRAYLLTSRDELNQVNGILVQGQANLDAITGAEKLLGQHQVSAEQELKSLTDRIAQTAQRSEAVYVRAKAKELLKQVQAELEKSKPVVFQKPASPYEARQFLANVEQLRTSVENTINFDHAAYDAANAAIAQAKSLISSADADIDKAARTNWSQSISGYGTVQHAVDPSALGAAKQTVAGSRSELSGAESKLGPQEYEKAKEGAETSQASANRAKAEVQRVVAAAHAIFEQKVAAGQAIAQADSEVNQAASTIDQCQRESWSQYVSDFGQVTHGMDYSDLSRARSMLDDARQSISSAKSAVSSENFDRAKSLAQQGESRAEESVSEARRAVESEHQVFLGMVREAQECAEAKQLISSAQSSLQRAESEVSSASRQSWSQSVSGYGTVSHSVSSSDLSQANSYLSSARSDISQAQSYLNSRNYSSAQSEARSASSNAQRAESEADSVVSREHSEFQRKVREAENSVQPPPGGGSDSGGGGGGTGGGGSGSTGGGW
ncbi:hypothetical protein IV102_20015 [bacterium]|nr:hypothetical protein [bacterium]